MLKNQTLVPSTCLGCGHLDSSHSTYRLATVADRQRAYAMTSTMDMPDRTNIVAPTLLHACHLIVSHSHPTNNVRMSVGSLFAPPLMMGTARSRPVRMASSLAIPMTYNTYSLTGWDTHVRLVFLS